MFAAVREPAKLKLPLAASVLVFAASGFVISFFGLVFALAAMAPRLGIESPTTWIAFSALTGGVLWVAIFCVLKVLVSARTFDLYWALCAVGVVYNLIVCIVSTREEQAWVHFVWAPMDIETVTAVMGFAHPRYFYLDWIPFLVGNMDYPLLVALLGLAYRRLSVVKVFGLIAYVGILAALWNLLEWKLFFSYFFPCMAWLGFSYVFLSEIEAIHKYRSSQR
jgi:hypothetical protein